MKRRVTQGFTIIEALIMCGVATLLFALIAQIFVVATRRTKDAQLRVDLQQSALMISSQLEKDFERTSGRAIGGLSGDPTVLSLAQAENWTSTGTVHWKQELVVWVYQPSSKTLHRETYPQSAVTLTDPLSVHRPTVPTPTELLAFANVASGKERVFSEFVDEFSLQDRTGSSTSFHSSPLTLRMKLRRTLSTAERIGEFTIERRIGLRNSF